MEEQQDESIQFYANGEAFEGSGVDLRITAKLLDSYRRLCDNTLPSVIGRKSLSRDLKEQIRLRANINQSSLDVLIDLIFSSAPHLPNFIESQSISHLIQKTGQIISNVIEYRRAWARLLEVNEGERPKINFNVSLDNVHVSDNGVININPEIVIPAISTSGAVNDLVRSIDGERVKFVDVNQNSGKLRLTNLDQNILGSMREELPKNAEVVGRLWEINFKSHSAQLSIDEGNVPVYWHPNLESEVRRFMNEEGVVFLVQPIVDRKRLTTEPVAYNLIDLWGFNGPPSI